MCNTDCFTTATILVRMRLSVTLPVLFYLRVRQDSYNTCPLLYETPFKIYVSNDYSVPCVVRINMYSF